MDLCQPDWFDSNLITVPTSIDLAPNNGAGNKRKRETTNRIDATVDDVEHEPDEQFNQVLNNYFHFSNPTSTTTWFQQQGLPSSSSSVYLISTFTSKFFIHKNFTPSINN